MTTTSKTTHTPGPWAVERDMVISLDDEQGGLVAAIEPSRHQAEDARLIAAAPAMLEKLEEVANLLYGFCGNCDLNRGQRQWLFDLARDCRETVAEAEGK
jgi:hypothetical protein